MQTGRSNPSRLERYAVFRRTAGRCALLLALTGGVGLIALPGRAQEGIKSAKDELPIATLEVQVPGEALDEATRVRLMKNDEIYKSVKDKEPLARQTGDEEYNAYGLVFLHVHKLAPDVLSRHARRDIVYADLLGDVRQQFLRELLHVEGRLVRVRKREASGRLRDTSDIKDVYEGWIYHQNEARHPICVVFTELPPEIQPGEALSYRVGFDGFYFKLMAYESQEKDAQGKPVWRVTPLLIGRGIQLTDTGSSMWSMENGFIPMVLILIGLIAVSALILTYWFRRGDRKIRAQMHEALTKQNPFEESSPIVQQGSAWKRLNEPPVG